MSWWIIIVSIIIVWIASLYKIFTASRSQSHAAFLSTGDKRNVLLVIAHPDDESMFFSPTINYLTSRGHNLHILCMSTGNADGMGNIRKDELYQACAVLKVPLEQVKILDLVDFQDGFGKLWNQKLLAKIVDEEVITHDIDLIITFDNYGVSGHCNHCDVHHGIWSKFFGRVGGQRANAERIDTFFSVFIIVCSIFLIETSQRNVEAWELISTNILRKYSGPLDIWISILSSMLYPRGQVHCLLNEHSEKSFLAMSQHLSQWVWFRKLFVSFSSYTYVNTLRRINS